MRIYSSFEVWLSPNPPFRFIFRSSQVLACYPSPYSRWLTTLPCLKSRHSIWRALLSTVFPSKFCAWYSTLFVPVVMNFSADQMRDLPRETIYAPD
ncbi:hypothetical protein C8Q76DRAFT_796776 [Earliella scabrosa]|nr:hypothetical protein C8Q76DRAFT_796776 [Earliella scabrosa]